MLPHNQEAQADKGKPAVRTEQAEHWGRHRLPIDWADGYIVSIFFSAPGTLFHTLLRFCNRLQPLVNCYHVTPISHRCQSSLFTQNQHAIFPAIGWRRRSNCPCAVFALSILGSWSFLGAVGAPAPLCFYALWAEVAGFLPSSPAAGVPLAPTVRPFARWFRGAPRRSGWRPPARPPPPAIPGGILRCPNTNRLAPNGSPSPSPPAAAAPSGAPVLCAQRRCPWLFRFPPATDPPSAIWAAGGAP